MRPAAQRADPEQMEPSQWRLNVEKAGSQQAGSCSHFSRRLQGTDDPRMASET